jgi:hypothetical protein
MSYVTEVEQLTMELGVAQPVDKGLTRGREIGTMTTHHPMCTSNTKAMRPLSTSQPVR